MPVSIDPKQYIIGAAEVYYRAIASVGAWSSVGATVDNVIFRANIKHINPSDRFNGLTALIREMDYLSLESAEVEFTMPQIAGPLLALAIRGAVSTATASTDATGTPGSTTLAAAAVIGDTNIKVTAITNFSPGDYVRISAAGVLAEYRQIDVVGTSGAGGTGISFRNPLKLGHANGDVVVETVGDGKIELTPGSTRRAPLSAYNDFLLVAQSPNDYYELFAYNAITTTDTAELDFGNDTMAAIKVTLGTRRDGANLSSPDWRLRVPA